MGMALAALALLASPAAAETGDHAKIVFDNGSILKKAEANCGAMGRLSRRDSLALTYARAAAEQSLPLSEFEKLFRASEAEATTASAATGFCAQTKRKRPAMMSRIKKAGQALAAKRVG